MSSRHKSLYFKRIRPTGSKPKKKVEEPVESLSDYIIENKEFLTFIPKSKFLEIMVDEINNGKANRITQRQK